MTPTLNVKAPFSADFINAWKLVSYVFVIDQPRGPDGWIMAKFFFRTFIISSYRMVTISKTGEYYIAILYGIWELRVEWESCFDLPYVDFLHPEKNPALKVLVFLFLGHIRGPFRGKGASHMPVKSETPRVFAASKFENQVC